MFCFMMYSKSEIKIGTESSVLVESDTPTVSTTHLQRVPKCLNVLNILYPDTKLKL